MPLLLNMLSSIFVIAFLPRSGHLLISWLQSLSTVILEPQCYLGLSTWALYAITRILIRYTKDKVMERHSSDRWSHKPRTAGRH